MPVDTRINVPFIPQEGITSQILQAIQLANEHHFQQQQVGLEQQRVGIQQQQMPSEIAQKEAATAQAEAETKAIPERLTLQQKQIDAELQMREATLKLEQQYRLGMLGVAQSGEANKERTDAAKMEQEAFRNLWESKLASAKEAGIAGNLKLRSESLAQIRDLTEQEIGLRAQANALRDKGLNQQADMITTRADDVVNHIGIIRSVAGSLGLAPATETPPAAGRPSAQNPAKPKAGTYNPATGQVEWK